MSGADWQALASARYLNLESFKRDGTAVRTPLWFAPDADGTFYIYSQAEAYKVKRLRRTPACRVAACDMRGNVSGPWLAARAEILSGDAAYVDPCRGAERLPLATELVYIISLRSPESYFPVGSPVLALITRVSNFGL